MITIKGPPRLHILSMKQKVASRALDSGDEASDSDISEEFQITKYLNTGLKANIQQAKASNETRVGIKRQPGHYNLKDRKHAVIESKVESYQGKHWPVSTPRLQRGTSRLTLHAINVEVAKEQLRRAKLAKTEQNVAVKALQPLNAEFMACLRQSRADEAALLNEQHLDLEVAKDEALIELMHRYNNKIVEEEIETERERQEGLINILVGMKEEEAIQKSPSLQLLIQGITDTNYNKSIVQQDILEAFGRYEDEEEYLDQEYRGAMMEMMDESLHGVELRCHRNQTKEMEEEERLRRVKETNSRRKDPMAVETKMQFDHVLGNLQATFEEVREQQNRSSADYAALQSDIKEEMLQEIRRKYAGHWADKMCAKEKARRIKEEESHLRERADPFKEAVLQTMAIVQRQMILSRFGGKWIQLHDETTKTEEVRHVHYEEMNDRDAMLKMSRLKARRRSGVAGEEDI